MKNKSWIIILIMGIALTISVGYSIFVNRQNTNKTESTVTTKSIIEMTATTATIKNTLTGSGMIEYKEKILQNDEIQENTNEEQNNINNEEIENKEKTYQITLSIEDKDLNKAKVGQDVEITIKKDEDTLNYLGKVIKIEEETNNKSTIRVEISNADEKVEENMKAICTVIIEKAENVVALPIEAIQINDDEKTFVDVVQDGGTTMPVIIETGVSDDYYVEITSGLNVGDRVQIIKSTTTTVVEDNQNNNINKNTLNMTSGN